MSQEQFVKAVIRQRIKIEDPEVYDAIVDIIYKFATLLQYGDDDIRRAAVDIVFQVLPDEVAAEIIRRYIDRVKRRYSTIKDIVKEMGREDTR